MLHFFSFKKKKKKLFASLEKVHTSTDDILFYKPPTTWHLVKQCGNRTIDYFLIGKGGGWSEGKDHTDI